MIKKNKGFTLIETMVVVTVFVLVMSLALAVFMSSIRSQRFSLYEQRLTNQTSYALSYAAKEIREGKDPANINANYFKNLLPESVNIKDLESETNNNRTTILLHTSTKVEEGTDVNFKLQTTTLSRE